MDMYFRKAVICEIQHVLLQNFICLVFWTNNMSNNLSCNKEDVWKLTALRLYSSCIKVIYLDIYNLPSIFLGFFS